MHKIGPRIRKWREERHLSMEQLADLSGLGAEFLALLEAEDILPSIGPLQKISRALGVRLGTFMDDQISRDPIVTRSAAHDDDLILRGSLGKSPSFHYTALGKGKSDRNMEPFLIEVMPEAATSSSHQGEEFIYVLEGTLKVEYGRDAHTLRPGDSIYYNSLVPHAVSAEGGPARILAVLYFPL